jgi:hypothetical protein
VLWLVMKSRRVAEDLKAVSDNEIHVFEVNSMSLNGLLVSCLDTSIQYPHSNYKLLLIGVYLMDS